MQTKTPLTEEQIEALEPSFIGLTWKKVAYTTALGLEKKKWALPKKTLGWQIAGWTSKWLLGEAVDENGKQLPWKFTKEQLRFVLWWYAVDERGRFIYRKGVLQRMKGWGKDPLLAVLCLVELVGPSRFAGWDENGDPIGERHPQAWVQVTAVNQAQTTNTMALIPGLISSAMKKEYDIKDGAVLIRAMQGTVRLVAVTSSYRALEGGRTTFTLLNETHHWVLGNQGHKMYETIDGNATKGKGGGSRYLAITNAYLPGEDSVAERMRNSWEAINEGRAVDVGFLYDSIEAHPETPLTAEAIRIVVPKIRGDAVWLDVEAIIASVLDTQNPPSRSRRMWLNQVVAEEDALFGPEDWKPLADESLTLLPGDAIVLGFDGGKTEDSTALIALRIEDMAAFLLLLEEPPEMDTSIVRRDENGEKITGWSVDRIKVNNAVHDAFATYKVKAFYADVALWESYISDWERDYGSSLLVKANGSNAIGWDMRGSQQKSTRANEKLMQTIFDKKIKHNGDLALRRHVLNAHRRTNNYGVSFGKPNDSRKVDAYAALMLAHEAITDLRTRGKTEKVKTGRGWFM